MSNNPYRQGERDYVRGWMRNPYMDGWKREEWQRGYDIAENADRTRQVAELDRREKLWNVPVRARDEYIAMVDDFSPATVLEFMLAMHPEPES